MLLPIAAVLLARKHRRKRRRQRRMNSRSSWRRETPLRRK